jgi:hypothetical protein
VDWQAMKGDRINMKFCLRAYPNGKRVINFIKINKEQLNMSEDGIKTMQDFYWTAVDAYFEEKKGELPARLKETVREDILYFVTRIAVKRALQTYLTIEELKNFDRKAIVNKIDAIDGFINHRYFIWYLIFSIQNKPAYELEKDVESNTTRELGFKFTPELATH